MESTGQRQEVGRAAGVVLDHLVSRRHGGVPARRVGAPGDRDADDPSREVDPVERREPANGDVRLVLDIRVLVGGTRLLDGVLVLIVDPVGRHEVERLGRVGGGVDPELPNMQRRAVGQGRQEAAGRRAAAGRCRRAAHPELVEPAGGNHRVVAVHIPEDAVAADRRERVVRVVDELRQGVVHQLLGPRPVHARGEVPRVHQRLAGEGRERDADQRHQGEHAEDQDQHDPAATGPGPLVATEEHGRLLPVSYRLVSTRPGPGRRRAPRSHDAGRSGV